MRTTMQLFQIAPLEGCSTTAGFEFVVAGGWHSALAGVLASIVFVAIVFVLTNEPSAQERRHERGPSLRILFVTFFVFMVAAFLWATVAGFPTTTPDSQPDGGIPVAVQPVLAVPAAFLLSAGSVLLFFAISWLVSAYTDERDRASGVADTAVHCFRLIAWLTAVEVWIAIETATRALAGRGWWYSPGGVAVVALAAIPFLFADRIADRLRGTADHTPVDGSLQRALGVIGTSAVIMVMLFAVVTGQPDSTLLHEGNWCGEGLPVWAAAAAVGTMALFLGVIAALALALPKSSSAPRPGRLGQTTDGDAAVG